jgi:dynein heavy chain
MYAYLLGEGADPTDSIETLARRKRKEIECVSMGEGQDVVALRAINTATSMGSWVSALLHSYCTYVYIYIHTYIAQVLLQNCHLGLDFVDSLEDLLLRFKQPESNCSPDFR